MGKPILLCLMMAAGLFCVTSCNDKSDEFDDKGNSSIISLTGPENAYMGDSIAFNFQISSNGPRPNQSKVQLLFDETIVSERIMLTPDAGTYSGKVLIPFLKNIPDGTITVKLRIQNERFVNAVASKDIQIIRPKFPELILKVSDGRELPMKPSEDGYTYKVTGSFDNELYATIIAPKYGQNGNAMIFGSLDGKISNAGIDNINFSSDTQGEYEVTFNTRTFEGTPFIKFALNDMEFEKMDDNNFKVDRDFRQGEHIHITGLKADYANYWINPAFFAKVKGTNGKTLKFLARDGKYRVTVVKTAGIKHFKVQVMNEAGTGLGVLTKGDDALWCNGDANIGQPSFSKNGCNWSTAKSICFAPMGNGIHKLILKKAETINTRNFKLYSGSGFEAEFKKANYKSFADMRPYFDIPADDGNIKSGTAGLIDGKYYVITVDVSEGQTKAIASCVEVNDFPEVEP